MILFGIIGFFIFISYGGNSCDQPPIGTCGCFCCHMFGLRGYESCAQFGLYAGALVGIILGLILFKIYQKKKLLKKE
ncbi:MAG: hypothetical protein NDI94_05895 [Candidatus Woesearchaeota archaeon]|nr:hypothetical protein [Candidatus Woesearchaeota archaeon]